MNPTSYPTPKSKFLLNEKNISEHRALVGSQAFQDAIDATLLQFSRSLTEEPPKDFNGAAASYLRLLGAQEFVRMLHSLSEQPKIAVNLREDNLIHRP